MGRVFQLKTRQYFALVAILMAVTLSVIALFQWQLGEKMDELAVKRVKEREMILVRSGMASITHFFKDVEVEACLLAGSNGFVSGDLGEIEKEMVHFRNHLDRKDEPVAGLAYVDKNGDVLKGLTSTGEVNDYSDKGISVEDRDYFQWALKQKNNRSSMIISPLIARAGEYEGKLVSGVAVPVFSRDQFNGVLVINIPVENISHNYIQPLVEMLVGDLFLINEKGTVLSATRTELLGEDFNNCLEEGGANEFGSRIYNVEALFGRGEGSFSYHCPREHWGKDNELLAIYNSSHIGSERILLMMTVPKREVIASVLPLRSFSTRAQLVLIGSLLVILVANILWVRSSQKDAFVNGYEVGKKKILNGVKKVKK